MAAALALGLLATASAAGDPAPDSAAQILEDLRSLGTVATILHIGAHPDDENTQLIAHYSRGRGFRTGYLSITRGDGGQNEMGPDFDAKLGVLRTQELLAAREIDAGRQFFTRAIDFGFSKSEEETLQFWDREQVLGDVVRVIRQFRPDVIVTRFPPPPGSGGHGHHTASAMLAVEAFKLAGSSKAYPEHLAEGLTPWQPTRVVWNGNTFSRGGGVERNPTITADIGGVDRVSGEPFSAIANRSRAMHKTQGFQRFASRPTPVEVETTFIHLAGEVARQDLFDGVVTTWDRFPGGSGIAAAIEAVIGNFDPKRPEASVPQLFEIRRKLDALGARHVSRVPAAETPPIPAGDPVLNDKREQLDRIIRHCLRIDVRTTTANAAVTPHERLTARHAVLLGSRADVSWTGVATSAGRDEFSRPLRKDEPAAHEVRELAAAGVLTHPYWLREDAKAGVSQVSDPRLIGLPENPPAFPTEYWFRIGDELLVVPDEVMATIPGTEGKDVLRDVQVIAPVSLRLGSEVALLTPGGTRDVSVEVSAWRPGVAGSVRLEAPPGWTVAPARQEFELAEAGRAARFVFAVTAPRQATSGRLAASAESGSGRYSTDHIELVYPHLPPQLLQPPATARLVCTDIAIRGRTVGYIAGAGDDTAQALRQLGYDVTELEIGKLQAGQLAGLDAVVIGVRAFERSDFGPVVPELFRYVEEGGTVVAQYNRPTALQTKSLGPYELSIQGPASDLRVTDESSPVVLLAPEHPALTTPNRITLADFAGWVQERGAYFPSAWDPERYVAVLACNDPGERALTGGLLIARQGKGHYVYTSLAFFRQLPAGVPGAYRLFANLVSLGK